jgi:hypothetical protein
MNDFGVITVTIVDSAYCELCIIAAAAAVLASDKKRLIQTLHIAYMMGRDGPIPPKTDVLLCKDCHWGTELAKEATN